MLKKFVFAAIGLTFLAAPLVASALIPIPQLPADPTVADLQKEIQLLSDILNQLLATKQLQVQTQIPATSNPTPSPVYYQKNNIPTTYNSQSGPSCTISYEPSSVDKTKTLSISWSGNGTSRSYVVRNTATGESFGPYTALLNGFRQDTTFRTFDIGTYVRTDTVVGEGGTATCSATLTIVATSSSATTNFSAIPSSGLSPLPVVFSVQNSRFDSMTIDYGDGSRSNVSACAGTPCSVNWSDNHTYATPGTYTAKLYWQCISSGTGTSACPPPTLLGTATITVTTSTSEPPTSGGATCTYAGGSPVGIEGGSASCRDWCLVAGTAPYGACMYKDSPSATAVQVDLVGFSIPQPLVPSTITGTPSGYTCAYEKSTIYTNGGSPACRLWCLSVGKVPYSTCTYKELVSGFTLKVDMGAYNETPPYNGTPADENSPSCLYENKTTHTNGGTPACRYWCLTVGRLPYGICKYKDKQGFTLEVDMSPYAMTKPTETRPATDSDPMCIYGSGSIHTTAGSPGCRYWCLSVGRPPYGACTYKDMHGFTLDVDINLDSSPDVYMPSGASSRDTLADLANALSAFQAALKTLVGR